MPTYEYECESCGSVFEKRQRFADEPLKVHEDGCGGPVHRLLSVPALQFKGSGWYITDYGRGNGPKAGSSDSAKGDSTKTETKTETKPAPAPADSSKG